MNRILKQQLEIAAERAIDCVPTHNLFDSERRLHHFIGAMEVLMPEVAEILIRVSEGKKK